MWAPIRVNSVIVNGRQSISLYLVSQTASISCQCQRKVYNKCGEVLSYTTYIRHLNPLVCHGGPSFQQQPSKSVWHSGCLTTVELSTDQDAQAQEVQDHNHSDDYKPHS